MKLYDYMKKEILSNISFFKRIEAIILAQIGKRIPVVINDNGTSYTDSKKIVLSADETILRNADEKFEDTPEILQSYFIGVALHEAEHVISSDFKRFSKYIDFVANDYKTQFNIPINVGKEIGKFIGNSIEDGRIERRAVNRLPVAKKHISIKNYIDFLGATCTDAKVEAILNNILSLSKRGKLIHGTKKLFEKSEVLTILEKIKDIIFEAVKEDNSDRAFELYFKVHYATRDIIGPELKSEMDDEDALNELLEMLSQMSSEITDIDESMQNDTNDICGNEVDNFTESSNKDTDNQSEGEEESDGDSGNSSKSGDGGDKSDTSNSKSEKSTDKESAPNQLSDDKDMLPKELIDSLVDEIKRKSKKDAETNQALQSKAEREDSSKAEEGVTSKEMKEISRIMEGEIVDLRKTSTNKLPDGHDCKVEGQKLENVVKKLLSNKKREKITNLRRGNLNRRALTGLVAKNDDRLFYKKEIDEIEDYAVFIMIDNSGSMDSYKLMHAISSSAILEEGLKNIVPLKIMAFNSDEYRTRLYLLKNFDECRRESVLYSKLYSNYANCDAYALKYAQIDLEKRSEKNKILFLVTDGQPTQAILKDAATDTIEAVRTLRKKGIQVIPIAISNSISNREGEYARFNELYGNRFIFTESENLASEITKYLKKIIK